MGLLWLATVPLTNGVVFTFMGPKYLATLGGIAFISHQIGGLFGAWSGGKYLIFMEVMIMLVDKRNSWNYSFYISHIYKRKIV